MSLCSSSAGYGSLCGENLAVRDDDENLETLALVSFEDTLLEKRQRGCRGNNGRIFSDTWHLISPGVYIESLTFARVAHSIPRM